MAVTLEDLKKSQMQQTMHGHGDGFFLYAFACIQYPRLQRVDKYIKKTRSVETEWRVDGEPVESFEAALAPLNVDPVFTEEEASVLAQVPDDFENLKQLRERLGGVNKCYSVLHSLGLKGALEYGKNPNRSDGEPWSDLTPEHLRFTPTIRKRK